MNATSTVPFLLAPVVALSTLACAGEPGMDRAEDLGEPTAQVEQHLGNSVPLLRTTPWPTVSSGYNGASAGHSGGTDIPSESDYDGAYIDVGTSYTHIDASASSYFSNAMVSSTAFVYGGGTSCGTFTISGSADMLAMVSAAGEGADPGGCDCGSGGGDCSSGGGDCGSGGCDCSSGGGDVYAWANYWGGAGMSGDSITVLDEDCSTTNTSKQVIVDGHIGLQALLTSAYDSFSGTASVGGNSVSVNCPAGPNSCSTTTVKEQAVPCNPGPGYCVQSITVTTDRASGATITYSFPTNVGSSISLSSSVNGNGGAYTRRNGSAGVNANTSIGISARRTE